MYQHFIFIYLLAVGPKYCQSWGVMGFNVTLFIVS